MKIFPIQSSIKAELTISRHPNSSSLLIKTTMYRIMKKKNLDHKWEIQFSNFFRHCLIGIINCSGLVVADRGLTGSRIEC